MRVCRRTSLFGEPWRTWRSWRPMPSCWRLSANMIVKLMYLQLYLLQWSVQKYPISPTGPRNRGVKSYLCTFFVSHHSYSERWTNLDPVCISESEFFKVILSYVVFKSFKPFLKWQRRGVLNFCTLVRLGYWLLFTSGLRLWSKPLFIKTSS